MRRSLANLGLMLASVLFALGAAEVGFRLVGYRAIHEIYSSPWVFWRYDPLLGWAHEPGAAGSFVGPRPWPIEFEAQVRINSLGLRGGEVREKLPGALRVLALGDSRVAGFEVEEEQTFTVLLGPLLEARLGVPVDVVNAGVRGYGTDQSYLYFRDRGRHLQPDLVLFFHSGNDAADNRTVHEVRRPFGKPAFARRETELELLGSPVPRYPMCSNYRLVNDQEIARLDGVSSRAICRAQMVLFDRSALFCFVTLRVPWNYDLLRRLYYLGIGDARAPVAATTERTHDLLTTRLVSALGAAVREQGAFFLVIGGEFYLRILDSARLAQEGIEIVTLEDDDFLGRRELVFRNDAHFNARGHRELAEFLAPLLAERLAQRSSAGESR